MEKSRGLGVLRWLGASAAAQFVPHAPCVANFAKRPLADAIGKVFRSRFSQRNRPARRRPVFEALEPRVLLSAELPVIPPQTVQPDAVLSAPLDFNAAATATVVAAQQPALAQVISFQNGLIASAPVADPGAALVLDFSAVKNNLQFAIGADGTVSVSDGAHQVTAANVAKIIGGAGDDRFHFDALPTAKLEIVTGGQGNDVLDFSALKDDLAYVTHTDGTLSVSNAAGEGVHVSGKVSAVAGQGANSFIEEKAPVIAGTIAQGTFSSAAADLSLAAYVASQPAPKQIVIIDSAVQDYESLLRSLPSSASSAAPAPTQQDAAAIPPVGLPDSPPAPQPADTLVVVLDPTWDGVEQITQLLAAYQDIAAVHIISHGSSGSIRLGTTTLDSAALGSLETQLRKWGRSLAPAADLLLYGCDVASGEGGLRFIEDLGALVGADVAASTDATGAAALGGDWDLEAATGAITASTFAFAGYDRLLPTTTFSGTAGDDSFIVNDVNVTLNNVAQTAAAANNDVLVNGLGGNDTFTVSAFNTGDLITINGGDGSTDTGTADKLDLSGVTSAANVYVKANSTGTQLDVYDTTSATPANLRLTANQVEWITARAGASTTLDLSSFSGDLRLQQVTSSRVEIAKNTGSSANPVWSVFLTAENFDSITGISFASKTNLVAGLNAVAAAGDAVEATGKLQQDLFVLADQSLGEVIDIGGALRNNIAAQISSLSSSTPEAYDAMAALNAVSGITATATRISGTVSLDIALNTTSTISTDLGLGDQIKEAVQVDSLRGDLAAGLQWSFEASETSSGTFSAASLGDMTVSADLNRGNFIGHAGLLGLNFGGASTVFLDAGVTVALGTLSGSTSYWNGLDATTVGQSGSALAKVDLVGSTTVDGVTVSGLPSATQNISLKGTSSGNTLDLFNSSASSTFVNSFDAGVANFYLSSAGEVVADLSGFADFLSVFSDKALGIAIPLSADGTRFGDVLNLDGEFRQNFLSLIQQQALSSSTLVSTLNNGGGVRTAVGDDLRITLNGILSFNVELNSTATESALAAGTTLGQLVTRIQAAATAAGLTTAQFQAKIDSRTGGLVLVTLNGSSLAVAALNQSRAAEDLDLLSPATRRFDDRSLVSELNGGTGIRTVAGADLRITIGSFPAFDVDLNASATDTTLDPSTTLNDLVTRIKNAAPAGMTSSDWDVSIDTTNFRLLITNKTVSPNVPAIVTALNGSNAVGDLAINSGAIGAPLLVAQNFGLQGATFGSIQELVADADAGSQTAITGFQYDTSGTPTLKFTAAVGLGADAADTLTRNAALFDAGALSGLVTTAGSVSLNPDGTLTLPFEIQLTSLGSGFNLGSGSSSAFKVSELNRGKGVETVAGNDIQVKLSDGRTFNVDLDHDPSTKLLSTLGFVTDAAQDVTVTLKDGTTFGVDLGTIGTKTLADLVTALNDAADAALGGPDQTKFEAKVNAARGSLVLIDRTTGGGTLAVTAPGALGLAAPSTKLLDGAIEYFAEASFYTLGDLMQMIRSAASAASVSATDFDLRIAASGKGIELYDATDGSGTFEVLAQNDSLARVSLGLTVSGAPLVLSSSTLISALNNGNGIGTASGNDIRITLRDGTNFQVDLDGAGTTVNDLLQRIQSAATSAGVTQAKFKVGTAPGFNTPALFDYTTTAGSGTFHVDALNGATAATKLGLNASASASQDDAGNDVYVLTLSDQVLYLTGTPLHDDALTSHVGVRGASLASSVTTTASGINATGLWGPVDVAITGGATSGSPTTINLNVGFADPGTDGVDGFSSLRELRAGLADVNDLIAAGTGTPTGHLELALPVSIANPFGGLTATVPLQISAANVFDSTTAPTVAFTGASTATQGFLQDVSTLTIDQVLAALDSTASYLTNVQDSNAEVSRPLPGLNRSLGQLLPFGERFDALLNVIQADPPSSLQALATALQGLGFTGVSLAYDPAAGAHALNLSLTYSPSQASAQRFNLDLNTLPGISAATLTSLGLDTIGSVVDINESSLISVTTTGTVNLDVGVDLTGASHTGFVGDSTTMSFALSTPKTDLNFSALLGVRSVDITAGSLAIDSDGAGASTSPATYAVTLAAGTNGRQAFAAAAAATQATFTGKIDASLPIVYPLDLNQPSTSTITLSSTSPGTTTLTATGPNVRDTLGSQGLNGNIQGLRAGFKELFRLLDFAFDAAIFSSGLPFVGKQLIQAADFINQIRDKVGDNFDFTTGILTPEKAQQALFDAFGPGGLNWLQDANSDGVVNSQDITVANIAAPDDGVEFALNLSMPQQLLEIPIDLDMILPGLGLVADIRPNVRFGFTMPLKFGISVQRGVYLDKSSIDDMAVQLDVTLPAPADASGFQGTLGTLPYRILERGTATGLHGTFDFALKDSDGRLTVRELMDAFGAKASPLKADAISAARNMILGGFTGNAQAHLTLTTDLPAGTALPTYRTDLDITNWSFSSTIVGTSSTTFGEVTPTITFDHTQFELVSFVRDFLGAMLTRAETEMDPLDWLVKFLTNESFPIVSLILGRAPYTSARTFGGASEVGNYANAAEAISRIVNGNNQSGSFAEIGDSFGYLVGNPFNPIDGFRPVPFDLVWSDPIWGTTLAAWSTMPDAMKRVGPINQLSGTAWIDIGGAGADFTIDGAAARTSQTQLAPQNMNSRAFGTMSTSDPLNPGNGLPSILAQIRTVAGRNNGDSDTIQDAALDFLATQVLPGRSKFEGFFGGGINTAINALGGGGVDPLYISVLNDRSLHNANKSFNLLFGDPKLGGALAPSATNLLEYSPPELFLYLYQDIPLSKKQLVDKVLGEVGGNVLKLGVEIQAYLAVAFEARADFAMAMDTTGLARYAKTRNPGDIVNGVYFDDTEGVEKNGPGAVKAIGSMSDEDEAIVLGGVGLGVQIVFTVSIVEFKMGIEALVFSGISWNLHDPDNSDGSNRIRANEFDVGANTPGAQLFDRSVIFQIRADVFAKLALKFLFLKLTIFDLRFNLFTLTLDIPMFLDTHGSLPTLGSMSGSVLTVDTSVGHEFYIGAGDNDGEVWISRANFSQLFTGVSSVSATGGSGDDFFYVSPILSVPVTIHGGGGADTLMVLREVSLTNNDRLTLGLAARQFKNVSFYGDGGNDHLYGGPGNDTLDGGAGDDYIWGGDGNDIIAGGSGLNTLYGYRGDDTITGGDDADLIYGDAGFDTISGGGGNDTIYGGKNNDTIDAGGGDDLVWGGDGRDTIHGGTGADTIHGELGNDFIYGDAGADTIFGEQNDDTLYGGADNDRLDGQGASDRLYGDNGPTGALLPDEGKTPTNQDVLISSEGNDYLDGEQDSDTYLLTYHGEGASSLITVLDTGSAVGTDIFQVTGTIHDDDILLRANNDGAGAFVALINDALNAERINYIGVERITVSGGFGNDHFVSDDTAAEVTLNGDEGNDTFQIGQIFNSPRTHDSANVSIDDEFATIETTRGFLSNGVSAPMTINGGVGNDSFTVYHNLSVLTLNGDDGDDTFQVKAFALVGSQEPKRARTDISGGAGADLVQYAVNAPVNIDGGDGFDTVVAIGTEFGDDLVITDKGVYGAGLNVNFANIESLRIDGAEGDDRFFVESTSDKFVTEIYGGLGNDTFFMSGDTPPVVSNDLLGYSGIVTHDVESVDPRFDAMKLFGISANVADNDEPGVVIRPSAGSTIITEGGQTDSYTVVLTTQPTTDIIVKALAPLPTLTERELRQRAFSVSSSAPGAVNSADGTSVSLRFTASNWYIPQTVTVGATSQTFTDAAGLLTRPELGDSQSFSYDDSAYEGVTFGVVNHVVVADVRSVQGQMTAAAVTSVSKATEAKVEITAAANGSTYSATIGGTTISAVAPSTSVSATLDALKAAFDTAKAGSASAALAGVTAQRMVQSTLTMTGAVTPGTLFSVNIGTTTVNFVVPDSGVSSAAQVATGLAIAINAAALTGVTADDRAQNGTLVLLTPASTTFSVGSNTSASAGTQLLVLSSEDGNLNTDNSTNFSVSGSNIRIDVDGSAGATTALVQDVANLNSSLIGRKITVVGGPGAGQQRYVVSIANNSIVTVDRPWNIDDAPTKESSFLIRVDDALVGQPTAVDSAGLTFTDTARTTPFPTAGTGLIGRTLQIVGGPGAGQQRLILGNTANTLTLNTAWTTAPTSASVYRIELFDGLAVPGVAVQVNDNDQAGLIVTESGDGTAVIEGGDGSQAGERDTISVQLSKTPSSAVTVSFSNPDGQLSTIAPITLNSTTPQTVNISAVNDNVREGPHTGLLNFALAGGNADVSVTRSDSFTVTAADQPTFYVGLTQTPASIQSVTITPSGGSATVRPAADYAIVGNKVVFLQHGTTLADGQFEAVTGTITVAYTYVNPGFLSAQTQPLLVRISDDDAPTVLVRETGGSTDVVEGGTQLVTIGFSGQTFAPDSLIGQTITIVSGTGTTQTAKNGTTPPPSATIISNTSNTLTIAHQWTVLPDSTTRFTISSPAGTVGISVPGSTTGTITATGSAGRNAYLINVKAGNTYTFDMDGADSGTGTLRDTYLRLFDSGNNQIAFDDDSGPGLSSHLVWTAGADGLYTLYAGSYVDASTGTYRLTTSISGDIAGGAGTGASLFVGSSATGVVDASGDQDWFRVALTAGNTYTFDLQGSSLSDPMLALYDTNGTTQLAFNDDFYGLQSHLSYAIATTGTYYLAAMGYSSHTGSYTLSGAVAPTQLAVTSTTVTDMRSDTYDVVLTAAPTASVTVTVTPQITKSTRTGGIRQDLVHLTLSSTDSRVVANADGTLSVTFTSADWDRPVVVTTTAIDDAVVEGGDTQVFAPHPNTLSGILGPVFVQGGGGDGSLGVTTAFILPGETNVKPSTGILSIDPGTGSGFDDATHIAVLTSDLQAYLGSGVPLTQLVGRTLEITKSTGGGLTAIGQFREILAVTPGNVGNETVLTLNEGFTLASGQTLSQIREYAISAESLNFFVNEASSVDVMFVNDTDSPADSSGVLTANTITGFHMGPDNVDGLLFKGRFKPFGITYNDLEVLDLNLGKGFNNLQVLGTPTRNDGYQTWTFVNTGDDTPDPNQPTVLGDTITVHLNATETTSFADAILHPLFASATNGADGRSTITFTGTPFAGVNLKGQYLRSGSGEERQIISNTANTLSINGVWGTLPSASVTLNVIKKADGAFALDAGAGNDTIDATGSTLPLILLGGLGNDTITGGSGDDIIFGDRGRVDFFGEPDAFGNRPIVTRVGNAPAPISAQATASFASAGVLNDSAAAFPVPDGNDIGLKGLYVSINNGTGFLQDPRLITDNTATSLTVSPAWSVTLDATSRYRISTFPENQTDGVVRDAGLIVSVDPTLGGNDVINAGAGNDQVLGGAGNDTISGQGGNDLLFGDAGRIDRSRDPLAPVNAVFTPTQTAPVVRTLLDRARTLYAGVGGVDVISGDDGADTIFGGASGDTLRGNNLADSSPASDGADIILGDAGEVDYTDGVVNLVATSDDSIGGVDFIYGNAGNDLLLGGTGGDTIDAGAGNNIVLGDSGSIDFARVLRGATAGVQGADSNAADIDLIQSTSTTADGGVDTITAGTGNDLVMGGRLGDFIDAGDGSNLVIGDSGRITAANADTPQFGFAMTVGLVETIQPDDGGIDTITTGTGNDVVLGGNAGDTLSAGAGGNIVLGDEGKIDYVRVDRGATAGVQGADADASDIDLIESLSLTANGGIDTITTGVGNDLIVGGRLDDLIVAGDGSNLVIGDSARITAANAATPQFSGLALTLGLVETIQPDDGGVDTITTGTGNDIVLGGNAGDIIVADAGNNIVLGDDGQIDYVRAERGVVANGTTGSDLDASDIDLIQSTSTTANGGADQITTLGGNDLIIGGRLGDTTLGAGDGTNLVIGDSARITAANAGSAQLAGLGMTFGLVETLQSDDGGVDTITTGTGNDIVVGGNAGDVINADAGNNIVLGDDGQIDYVRAERGVVANGTTGADLDASDIDLIVSTSTTANGGVDQITTLGGNDLIIGGRLGDTVLNAGDGTNLVIGDSGRITAANSGSAQLAGLPMTFGLVETLQSDDGGNDTITTGTGNDIVLGGNADDTINADAGNNIVLGDDGQIDYVRAERGVVANGTTGSDLDASDIDLIASTSTTANGGVDQITTLGGNDLIIGGRLGDTVLNAGDGTNLVIGDSAQITAANAGSAQLSGLPMTFGLVETLQPDDGGSDTITTGTGNDIVLGGNAGDVINADAGNNIVLGDDGQIDYVRLERAPAGTPGADLDASDIDLIASTSTTANGGVDQVTTLGGSDLIIGGRLGDGIDAGDGTNLVIGDSAQITAAGSGSAQLGGLAMTLGLIETLQPDDGGNDTIATGVDNDIVLGGNADDTISADAGDNIVLGDDGQIDYVRLERAAAGTPGADLDASDIDLIESTSTTAYGGVDQITTLAGNDIVIGGRFGDTTLNAGDGSNLVIGDSGRITAANSNLSRFSSLALTIGLIETTEFNDGGADAITTGVGRDIILGGDDGDTIIANSGEVAGNDLQNIVLGDDGLIDYVRLERAAAGTPGADLDASDIDLIESASTLAGGAGNTSLGGGIDTITTGAAADIVIAGRDNDTVTAGDGTNLVIGDSGRITAANSDLSRFGGLALTVGLIETIAYGDGGVDTLSTGIGNDIVLGGHLGDTISADAGDNIVLGDDGQIDYVRLERAAAGTPGADLDAADIDLIESTSTSANGGVDQITTLAGNDIVIGGRFGDTTLNAGDGSNLVIGDSGRITAANSNLSRFGSLALTVGLIETITPADGGNDSITTGTGNDLVLAGNADDTVNASSGNNIVLGDDGLIDYVRLERAPAGTPGADLDAADIDLIESTSTSANGGVDQVTTLGGNDIVLAGRFGDTVDAGDGLNVVIGDSGRITAGDTGSPVLVGQPMTFGVIETVQHDDGGADQITTGTGNDTVLGGFAGDTVTSGSGNDAVVGDNGEILFNAAGSAVTYRTTDAVNATGGDDVIQAGDGADWVLAGTGSDNVAGGNGADVILGDNGVIQLDATATLFTLIETRDFDALLGANDVIDGGGGNNIVLAGFGGDTLTTGADDDIAFGDNGTVQFTNGIITLLATTDTVAQTGGDDAINAGDGNNLVFGGVGSDTVTTGIGSDVVLGDNGSVTNDASGAIQQVLTGDPALGGSDVIATGDGNDLAVGGAAGDTVTSAGGNDILFGDGIDITYSSGGTVIAMISQDEAVGGNDTLDGGAGNDILVAGQGDDLLYGNLSEDLLFGGNAAVTEAGGVIQKIETDTHDRVTQAIFEEFNSLPTASEEPSAEPQVTLLEDLPGYAAFVVDPLSMFPQQVELLSVAVFEKLFNSAVVSHLVVPSHLGTTEPLQGNSAPQDGQQAPQNPQQDGAPQDPPAGAQDPQGPADSPSAGMDERPSLPTQYGSLLESATVADRSASSDSSEHASQALGAAAGFAGVVSERKSRGSARKLLDRDAMAGIGMERGVAGETRTASRPRKFLIEW